MRAERDWDVVVIGGGPAGATTATLTAMHGHRVILLERETEPRFKIGESLMPSTYWVFERLGILDELRATSFPRKHSVQFFSRGGRASMPFYFSENNPHESSVTWQVLRTDFERILLDNAQRHAVEVTRGAKVREVLFDGDQAVGVVAEMASGEIRQIAAQVVVDATGQSALMARRLGLKETDPLLMNASIFTHFKGAVRDRGRDEGATLTFHTENQQAWFWSIPLPDDRVSIGVVGPLETLITKRGSDPQAIFEEELALCPALQARLAGASQVMEMQVLRDFSYTSRQLSGNGWVLVGDAFGFVDPIYSSGIMLALKSGQLAADAIHHGLQHDDVSAATLGAFEGEYRHGIDALCKLVYAFYAKEFSFGAFLERFPEHRRTIVELLTGNAFGLDTDGLFDAMGTLFDLPGTHAARPPAGAASSR